jgi:repressor LexA
MSAKLTSNQKRVLEIIYTYLEVSGFPPTIADLKVELGVSSNQAVLNHLKALEKKECIKREEGQARGIRILPFGYKEIEREPLIKVLGTGAAGPYLESYADAFSCWMPLQKGILQNEQIRRCEDGLFAIQVHGDSMINVGIDDGDYLLVKKTDEFKSNDIVVARRESETTVKRFIADGGKRYLKPENPNYENIPIIPGEIFFDGKVILNLSKIK